MKHWRKMLFGGLVLLLVTVGGAEFDGPERVMACSGGGPDTLEEVIAKTDIIVYAEAVEVDYTYVNARLEVQYYLAGGPGPTHLFLHEEPLLYLDLNRERWSWSSGGCSPAYPRLEDGKEYYFFLKHDERDGSYELASGERTSVFSFGSGDETAEYVMTEVVEKKVVYHTIEVDEQQFLTDLSLFTPLDQIDPDQNDIHPLSAPILVTTEAGTRYLYGIDGSQPVELTEEELGDLTRTTTEYHRYATSGLYGCTEPGCSAHSPNGLDEAEITEDGRIRWFGGYENFGNIPGRGFLFSPWGETLVIEKRDALEIYLLRYPTLGAEIRDRILVNSLSIVPGRDGIAGRWIYSPDGRTLAFGDAAGLWLWDVYSPDVEPRLLIPADEKTASRPYPRYFSPMGRYLAVTNVDRSYTLDLITGERLLDGVISPDERKILVYDTAEPLSLMRACIITNDTCTRTAYAIREARWTADDQYIFTTCEDLSNDTCRVMIERINRSSSWPYEGFDFDYQSIVGSFVIAVDEGRLLTMTPDRQYHEIGRFLDGAIVDIEWLPPLWIEDYPIRR
jgi:hypothetical protein